MNKKSRAKKSQNRLNLFFILLALAVLSLGCLGPSASDSRCEGTVKIGGETFTGAAKDEKRAELNACNKFCLEKDSEFEAMYAIWLDSADGRRIAEKLKRKPTKEEAIMESERLLDYITKNCAERCVKQANKGKHTLESSCK